LQIAHACNRVTRSTTAGISGSKTNQKSTNQQNKDQEISRKKTEYETKKDEYEILISNLKNQKVTVFIELPIADQPLYYNFDLKKLNLTYVKDLDPKQLRADTIKGYDGTQLSLVSVVS
jgi:hypothetical protein